MNKYATFSIAIVAYCVLMFTMFLEFLGLYSGTILQGVIDSPTVSLIKGISLFIAYLFTGIAFLQKTKLINIPMAILAFIISAFYSMAYAETPFPGAALRTYIDAHHVAFGWVTLLLSTLLASAVSLFRRDGERGLVKRAIIMPPVLFLLALPLFNNLPLFSFAPYNVNSYLFTFVFCALNVFLVPMLYTLVTSKMPRHSLVLALSLTGGTLAYMIGKLGALGYTRDAHIIAEHDKIYVLIILIAMVLYTIAIFRVFLSGREREA